MPGANIWTPIHTTLFALHTHTHNVSVCPTKTEQPFHVRSLDSFARPSDWPYILSSERRPKPPHYVVQTHTHAHMPWPTMRCLLRTNASKRVISAHERSSFLMTCRPITFRICPTIHPQRTHARTPAHNRQTATKYRRPPTKRLTTNSSWSSRSFG